jgi:hypothetical protein
MSVFQDFVQDSKISRFPEDSQDLKILFSLTAEDLSDSKIFLLKIFQDFPRFSPRFQTILKTWMKTFSSDKDSEFAEFTVHQSLFMHYSPVHYSCYCSCVNFVRILYLCSPCLLNESIKMTLPFICKQNL